MTSETTPDYTAPKVAPVPASQTATTTTPHVEGAPPPPPPHPELPPPPQYNDPAYRYDNLQGHYIVNPQPRLHQIIIVPSDESLDMWCPYDQCVVRTRVEATPGTPFS